MALPVNTLSNSVVVSALMADSGTASSVYIAAPVKGRIIRLIAALGATAVTTANNVFTAHIAKSTANTTFVAVNHDTWTQPFTGSAAGQVNWVNVSSNNYVNVGDTIRITTDGGGSAVTPTTLSVVIAAE